MTTANAESINRNMVVRRGISFSHWGIFHATYFMVLPEEDIVGNAWHLRFLRPLNFSEEIEI